MHPRLKGFGRGALRGAKFGALVGMVIWLALQLFLGVLMLIPKIRASMLADLDDYQYPLLAILGSAIATFCLMSIYGALGGAVVMGLAGLLRPAQRYYASNTENEGIPGPSHHRAGGDPQPNTTTPR